MKISQALLDEIVAHAQDDPTIECCGLVAVEAPVPADVHDRTAARVYRAANIHASALKFQIDPMEQLELTGAIEDNGWEIGGLYHSHVRSKPYPSQTDINFAASLGSVEWIIVGLAPGQEPEVCSYLIEDGEVREVPLEVR
jgi:proteasome lid subunit RPN8/RPN11